MNCANHPSNPVAAYCRTCGKPLCSSCTRQVMGVIYCENCLAERVSGSAPQATAFQPAPGYQRVPTAATGPNPALAGLLGAIPFGVGAVYNGQYAKGLAHLVIFLLLVIGASHGHEPVDTICGIAIAAFVFYQIIDAVKTAKAINAGQRPPDPLGLGTMFSTGDRPDFSKGVPTGALVLIGLGVLFLLHNLGVWFLEVDRIWPIFLIGLGAWLFTKRRLAPDGRYRSVTGPAILVTVGVLSLVDNMHGPGWDRTWPLILVVIGGIKLFERGHFGLGPGGPGSGPPAGSAIPPEQPLNQQPPSEVDSEVKNG